MRNPVLIELTRGALVESAHAGAIAVVRQGRGLVAAIGDVAAPVFPRSAIKPLQTLPLLETGAADRFGFGDREIAIASASHSGTAAHVEVVGAMLGRAGLAAAALSCGRHEPFDKHTADRLAGAGGRVSPLHHNCSGKHAAMLATAVHGAEPVEGYWRPDHPVQVRIARVLQDMTGCPLDPHLRSIDGCSVPNWAMPLSGLAQAFAELGSPAGLAAERAHACRRVAQACWRAPDLFAGPGRLDTEVLEKLPRKALLKGGAEGVYAGALPEHGLGFALKIDDGAKRAAEAVAVALVARLYPQIHDLGPQRVLRNWRGLEVGELRCSPQLEAMLGNIG